MSVSLEQRLHTLAQWLAGEFDNQAQANNDPTWFVPLKLWHYPLPQRLMGNLALFAEQANFLQLEHPYRQRMLMLELSGTTGLQVRYWAFRQPEQFRGAGADPSKLAAITPEDLEYLPGCWLKVEDQGDRFLAQPEPEAKCCFQSDGQVRQVVLGFEARAEAFHSYDRGVDPATGQSLWEL